MAEVLRVEEEWRRAEEALRIEAECWLAAEAEEHWLAAEAAACKLEEVAQREQAAEERCKKQRAEKVKKAREQERELGPGLSQRGTSGNAMGRKWPRVVKQMHKGKGKVTSRLTLRGGKQKMGRPDRVCQHCSELGKECLLYSGEHSWVFMCAACHKDRKGCKPIRRNLVTRHVAELQEACHTNELLQELIKTMAGIEATQQEQLQVRQNLNAIWQQGWAGLGDLEGDESDDEYERTDS
ncbi:hypothetical protein P691DRAFT_785227, partial [Macrolepiota fuliginosa MF-IS2]